MRGGEEESKEKFTVVRRALRIMRREQVGQSRCKERKIKERVGKEGGLLFSLHITSTSI